MTPPDTAVDARTEVAADHALAREMLDLAVEFVTMPLSRLDHAIEDALRRIGRLSGVARTYLFSYDWESVTASNTHEWCAPGVPAVIADLQDVDVSELHDWLARHRDGEFVYRPDTRATSVPPAEREMWEAQGITALLSYPLIVDTECVGFVGFDVVDGPRHWSSVDLELLGVLARLLSRAEERRHLEQLRQAALELAEANSQLAGFADAVAHDLRAPLTTVRGMLELLGDPRTVEDQRRELRDRAIAATDRMSAMIERLLEYAVAGRVVGELRPVPLTRLAETAVEQVAALLDDHDAEVDIGPLPTVLGDEVRLGTVVQNLLTNAVVHTPRDRPPRIEVRGHRSGTSVVVTVTDNGDGIASEQRARALEPLGRLAADDAPGVGLGLALTARVVGAHGGSLVLEDGPSGGLRVRITLQGVPAEVAGT